MIVSTPREYLWEFIHARLEIPWSSDFRAVGIVKNDCLCAVIAYNGFTGRACFMHSAIDDPSVIDRTFVKAIFEYPFNQCGCSHVLALVDSANQQAMDIDTRLGFKELSRLPRAGLEGDLVTLVMAKDECKWIKHGQEKSPTGTRLHESS